MAILLSFASQNTMTKKVIPIYLPLITVIKKQTAALSVQNGYHLVTVFGPDITANTLTLEQNSGALYKVVSSYPIVHH